MKKTSSFTLRILGFAIPLALGFAAGVVVMYHFDRCCSLERTEPYINPVHRSIRHFVSALEKGDARELAQHVRLPFEREYPIPPIRTMDEFVAAIPSLLGSEAVAKMSRASEFHDWEELGGYYTLGDVGIWLSGSEPVTIKSIVDTTEAERALWQEYARLEISNLHPSLQDGVARPIASFITEDGTVRGRIDLMGDELSMTASDYEGCNYRLAVYNAGSDLKAAPDVVVMCKYRVEGSICNQIFESEDGQYRVMLNEGGPCDFAEVDFYRPGIPEDDDVQSRAKLCEWRG